MLLQQIAFLGILKTFEYLLSNFFFHPIEETIACCSAEYCLCKGEIAEAHAAKPPGHHRHALEATTSRKKAHFSTMYVFLNVLHLTASMFYTTFKTTFKSNGILLYKKQTTNISDCRMVTWSGIFQSMLPWCETEKKYRSLRTYL